MNSTSISQNRGKLAYTFGNADARHGASCVPEVYFTHKDDKRSYCEGYAAVAGHNITTEYFLGKVTK